MRRPRLKHWLVLGVLVVNTIAAGLGGYGLQHSHEQAVEKVRATGRHLSELLAGSLASTSRQIDQVLINLVTNARDAISSLPEPSGVILLATSATPHGAMLRVHDTGPGIPHDLQQRIFQPFFTTREGEASGRGLGLTIVERVARRHGAQLTLHSEPGQGADFQVLFPAPR